jgi:hypothetical protein
MDSRDAELDTFGKYVRKGEDNRCAEVSNGFKDLVTQLFWLHNSGLLKRLKIADHLFTLLRRW